MEPHQQFEMRDGFFIFDLPDMVLIILIIIQSIEIVPMICKILKKS